MVVSPGYVLPIRVGHGWGAGQLLLIEISTIQPFTVILMHTGASPFFNNLPFLMKNKTENDLRAIFTSFLELQNYVFSSKVSLCKILWISEKYTNSWDFFRLNFSPTIYPPIICLKRLFSAICQKKEIPDNVWLSGIFLNYFFEFQWSSWGSNPGPQH